VSFATQLLGFGLRQVIAESADSVVQAAEVAEQAMPVATRIIKVAERYFRDHSRTLPNALEKAHDRAWQAMAVALAGDGLLDRVKVFFASGDDKGVREQVQLFLEDNASAFEGTPDEFRRSCLEELKHLRKSGQLSVQTVSPAEVAQQAAAFSRHADPQGLIEDAQRAVVGVADALAEGCPNLSRLIRRPTPAGPPLLAVAFCYFFRREIETNEELARGLLYDGLRHLTASQEMAFGELTKAIATLGVRFDDLFGQLGRIETVVVETHGAVLDIQVELQRLGSLHLANADEVRSLLEQVRHHLAQAGMLQGGVKPQHSFSIRGEDERRIVKALLVRFRGLPPEEQQHVPALLNGLGKLQLGAGDFAEAGRTFAEVVTVVPDPSGKAEASHNAYRVALEEKKYDAALEALKRAASLDAGRFAPFLMHRYEPRRILGAGGFGTAVLCLDRHFDEEVVVKTLHAADLERGLEEVFREARVLRRLSHPAIIGVRDCEYADQAAKARPYLVMDYFPGMTLEDHVATHGTLAVADLVEVAKQVARGMQAAHAEGSMLHRDLKPANILVRKGDDWQVKVIDFGLALRKQVVETSMAVRSAGNTVLSDSVAGTLQYAPPEQMGRLPGVKVGPYSDVYAFGKTCCYALFRTTEPRSRHLGTLPGELRELLEGCIEQELEHRHASFETVLPTLEALDPARKAAEEEAARPQGAVRKRREQEPWQKAQPKGPRPGEVTTFALGSGVPVKFTWCPAGTFLMGSPSTEEGRCDNETQHRVTLTRGYWLGIYQVTQAQWQAVMGSNPSRFKGKTLPVQGVSWNDCQEFVKKLGEKTGKRFRLPTEAEWEHACRAGTTTPFHFGETISTDQVNYDGGDTSGGSEGVSRGKTTPVGSFPANAWGLYDMHGNVWDWCHDWYGAYLSEDINDPKSTDNGVARVLRGGSWYDSPRLCRSAYRGWHVPDRRYDNLGCRVVLCLD
jgi:formylglycine-generating enzyme required for sulfatase activity/tRNA A-37 threonylcarbamoyl transferase component Bud32